MVLRNVKEAEPPTRLIICVDGTWLDPDGLEDEYTGNQTNIYRIWAVTKEGIVRDRNGRVFNQKRKYFRGIGGSEQMVSRMISGMFGVGCSDQIKEIYQYCCNHLTGPEDELFLFGFSRGAYIARAVAGLLHHMHAIKADPVSPQFDQAYREALGLYRAVRSQNAQRMGSIHQYFATEVRTPPTIKFVGVFDTIKATNDDYIHDLSFVDSIKHFRHAMALNETREKFKVERCLVPPGARSKSLEERRTLIEAWFIGAHWDVGGSADNDGLSLYPFHWIVSEAEAAGLVLGFVEPPGAMKNMVNPLNLVFPPDKASGPEAPGHKIVTANGIQYSLHDFRHVHKDKILGSAYSVRINTPAVKNFIFAHRPREPFLGSQLIGFDSTQPLGTTIHPSVYLIFDTHPRIYLNAKSWGFRDDIQMFRQTVIPDEEKVFWDHAPMDTDSNLKAIRILICGNAGVGKSTLLNKVFGLPLTPESERAHGVHDIEKVFASESHPGLLIHDSCGFQAGNVDEVEKVKSFLRSRATSPDISERLHAIWYCTLTSRTRTVETSDEMFFETMAECASKVPVIVVGTRVDEYKQYLQGRVFAEFCGRSAENRGDIMKQLEEMDDATEKLFQERRVAIEADLRGIPRASFEGPVFVSKDDPRSINRLETVTLECLDNDRIRMLYVSAQICDVDQKVDSAITETMRLYGHSTRTAAVPVAFSGMAGTSTTSFFLCKNILRCFGYQGLDGKLLFQILHNMLWASMDSHSLQILSGSLVTLSETAIATGFGAAVGILGLIASIAGHVASIPASARTLLMCACDIILILERAFWYGEQPIGGNEIRSAAEEYINKRGKVHADVKELIPLVGFITSFKFTTIKLGVERIVRKHRFQSEPEEKA